MTDTIIKNTGNSRSIRSVPNLAALAPTWEKALEMLTSEAGLPIDMGPLNPLGVDVMGTPLDSEHLVTIEMGHYQGTGLSGKANAVTLQFSSTPKFILVASDGPGTNSDGIGFIFPEANRAVIFYYRVSNTIIVVPQQLYVSVEGGTVSYHNGSSSSGNNGYIMLNSRSIYRYIAFL